MAKLTVVPAAAAAITPNPIRPRKFKVPRRLGDCADLLYQLREQRYTLQHAVDAIHEQEQKLKDKIIAELPKSSATGVAGRVARVQVTAEQKPTVEDWTALYAFIQREGRFDLLQRRVSEAAVVEMWKADAEVPGVGTFNVVNVSCTALKGGKINGRPGKK